MTPSAALAIDVSGWEQARDEARELGDGQLTGSGSTPRGAVGQQRSSGGQDDPGERPERSHPERDDAIGPCGEGDVEQDAQVVGRGCMGGELRQVGVAVKSCADRITRRFAERAREISSSASATDAISTSIASTSGRAAR